MVRLMVPKKLESSMTVHWEKEKDGGREELVSRSENSHCPDDSPGQ